MNFEIIWLIILTIAVIALFLTRNSTTVKKNGKFLVMNDNNTKDMKENSIIIGIENDRFIVAQIKNGKKYYYIKNGIDKNQLK